MAITFDPVKRNRALSERGLDFADAERILRGAVTATTEDNRIDYGERRYRTAGFLADRLVVIVWTPRGADRHIISMRYCHAKEERKWIERMGRSG